MGVPAEQGEGVFLGIRTYKLMLIYFSGGSEIAEASSDPSYVMLSAFSHVRKPRNKPWRPNKRMMALLKIRRKERKGK